MKGDQSEKVAITKGNRPDPLTQTKRVHLRTVGRLQVLKCFPTEARMAIEHTPVKFAQPPQRGGHLLQIAGLEAQEHFLKLWAVQVETNAATAGGHVRA
jgi:hypothetical protein